MYRRTWMPAVFILMTLAFSRTLSASAADPLAGPAELQAWVRQVTFHADGIKGKAQAILSATFRPEGDQGLGIVYDNTYTRNVQEVWRDRKANCLGLTAFMVAACNSIGLESKFAEPINMNHWRKEGQLVRMERHVVAVIPVPPGSDLVADFLPQLRPRNGRYVLEILSESRIRALFYSNRAVELMMEGDLPGASESGKLAVQADATSSAAWNIAGVVHRALKEDALAEVSFKKALGLNAKDGASIGNLEQLMMDLGRRDEAAYYRSLAMETRKHDPYFNAFLAEEAQKEGRLDEALDLIRTAIKLLPYESDLYFMEARFQLELGKTSEARKSLEKARRWAVPGERERYDTKLALLAKL